MKDLFGKAILDYQQGNYTEDLITETSISEADELPLPYLFRGYGQMPLIEQKALQLSVGHVLDVGCGAGSHSLYLQEKKGLKVTAIDVSPGAIETCKLRGIKDTHIQDVMNLKGETFDTILLLMNGAGMCGSVNQVSKFLKHLTSLLNKGGQILLDSSDIIYMFDKDENGASIIPLNTSYYGEVVFNVYYKNESEEPFNWLYLDYNTLQEIALSIGLQCELIQEGEHYDYLAKVSLVND